MISYAKLFIKMRENGYSAITFCKKARITRGDYERLRKNSVTLHPSVLDRIEQNLGWKWEDIMSNIDIKDMIPCDEQRIVTAEKRELIAPDFVDISYIFLSKLKKKYQTLPKGNNLYEFMALCYKQGCKDTFERIKKMSED